jgi:hypothetical protein
MRNMCQVLAAKQPHVAKQEQIVFKDHLKIITGQIA